MTLVTNRVMVNVYMVYDLYPKPVCVDHVSAGNLVAIGYSLSNLTRDFELVRVLIYRKLI